jgi:hypothetical protein
MDTQIAEEELRSLAYRLWEEAGCPDGRADEFLATGSTATPCP